MRGRQPKVTQRRPSPRRIVPFACRDFIARRSLPSRASIPSTCGAWRSGGSIRTHVPRAAATCTSSTMAGPCARAAGFHGTPSEIREAAAVGQAGGRDRGREAILRVWPLIRQLFVQPSACRALFSQREPTVLRSVIFQGNIPSLPALNLPHVCSGTGDAQCACSRKDPTA